MEKKSKVEKINKKSNFGKKKKGKLEEKWKNTKKKKKKESW